MQPCVYQLHYTSINPGEVTVDNYRPNMAVVPLDNYRPGKDDNFKQVIMGIANDFEVMSFFASIDNTTAGMLIIT